MPMIATMYGTAAERFVMELSGNRDWCIHLGVVARMHKVAACRNPTPCGRTARRCAGRRVVDKLLR